jgi:hypothetical protein
MAVLHNCIYILHRIMKNLSFRNSGIALQPEAYKYNSGKALCLVSVPRLLFAARDAPRTMVVSFRISTSYV